MARLPASAAFVASVAVLAALLPPTRASLLHAGAAMPATTCVCESDSLVPECCCDFKSVTLMNQDHVAPILRKLAWETRFFQYYRVGLCDACPAHLSFAPPTCGSPECAVCDCPGEDLPCDQSGKCYLTPPTPPPAPPASKAPAFAASCFAAPGGTTAPQQNEESRVDYSLGDGGGSVRWREGARTSWTVVRERGALSAAGVDGEHGESYVDLHRNPERWTGYTQVRIGRGGGGTRPF